MAMQGMGTHRDPAEGMRYFRMAMAAGVKQAEKYFTPEERR
jgi:hypothetical protein